MNAIRTPEADRAAERTTDVEAAAEALRSRADPLTDATTAALADRIAGDAYVLLGEASHGTAEFYRRRAGLTARLVRRGEVDFVAVEGDWTDCHEIHRYVTHQTDPEGGARDVLASFDRWPTWMWANWEVLEFLEWLREENGERPPGERVGFYGMDVYSLFESMAAVVDYLEGADPAAADRAREAYACFEPYAADDGDGGDDGRSYARSLRLAPEDCEDEAVSVLADLRREASEGDVPGGPEDVGQADREATFAAEQNALVAANAESYYRAMVRGGRESWNVRDRHMVETLQRLREFHDGDGSAVVWAHNTHVGDARATDMPRRGRVNVGQLIREAVGRDETSIVGFGTNRGTVVAGEAWGDPPREMTLPRARAGSHEAVFERAGVGDALVTFGDDEDGPLADPRGNRAVGVVYHPKRELGNYVPTVLPDRYDAFCFVDETTALHPLREADGSGTTSPPETYPWGV